MMEKCDFLKSDFFSQIILFPVINVSLLYIVPAKIRAFSIS